MRIRKAVIAAVLLAVPVLAWGQQMGTEGRRLGGPNTSSSGAPQPVVQGGILRADTTFMTQTFDASGNLKVSESSPAHTDFRDGSVAIIDDTTAVGMADSSVVINMGKYRVQGLAIRMVGNPSLWARLAVQVRFHLNSQSDSSSVFPWKPRFVTGGYGQDSLSFSNIGHPTAVAFGRTEFVVTVTDDRLGASKWGNQANEYIMLRDIFGTEFWAPYISVRIRNLSMTTAVGDGNDTAPAFKVYLTGTPQ